MSDTKRGRPRKPKVGGEEKRWKAPAVPRSRIERHMEELGALDTQRQRALAAGDRRGLVRVAREYRARGMSSTAREVEREAENL